jgi:hypothetical protein
VTVQMKRAAARNDFMDWWVVARAVVIATPINEQFYFPPCAQNAIIPWVTTRVLGENGSGAKGNRETPGFRIRQGLAPATALKASG